MELEDFLINVPKRSWIGADYTIKTCPKCGGTGTNYCGMCRWPLSEWALHQVGGKPAVKEFDFNGRKYLLNDDDVFTLKMLWGFVKTSSDQEEKSKTPPKHIKEKDFYLVYWDLSGIRRMLLDLAVDNGSIILD